MTIEKIEALESAIKQEEEHYSTDELKVMRWKKRLNTLQAELDYRIDQGFIQEPCLLDEAMAIRDTSEGFKTWRGARK